MYQFSDIVPNVPMMSVMWWSSLVERLTLMLILPLWLPRWGTPTPLSAPGPTSSGVLCFPFGNLLALLSHGWW